MQLIKWNRVHDACLAELHFAVNLCTTGKHQNRGDLSLPVSSPLNSSLQFCRGTKPEHREKRLRKQKKRKASLFSLLCVCVTEEIEFRTTHIPYQCLKKKKGVPLKPSGPQLTCSSALDSGVSDLVTTNKDEIKETFLKARAAFCRIVKDIFMCDLVLSYLV